MKSTVRFCACWLPALALLLGTLAPARAQTTRLDLTYLPHRIYQPAGAQQALQLANGSRIVLTDAPRANGQPANHLVRYTAAGALDVAFGTTVATYTWDPTLVAEDNNGRLLVAVSGSVTVAGPPAATYPALVRLLPSGAIDATFAGQPARSGDGQLLVQADGRLLVTGFVARPGSIYPGYGIKRLLPNGAPDAAYEINTAAVFDSVLFMPRLALQADGKLLVAGRFSLGGQRRALTVVRLNPDGTRDASFVAPTFLNGAELGGVAAVPGGGAVVTSLGGPPLLYQTSSLRLVRLTAAGALDPAFAPPLAVVPGLPYRGQPTVLVQPDGKVLFFGSATNFASALLRLLPSGAIDPAWNPSAHDRSAPVTSLQLLPTGNIVVSGQAQRLGAVTDAPLGAGTLAGATGAFVPGFAPALQAVGVVYATALQPDGKLVIGGSFSELNGTPVRNLARLLPNGTLDAAFTAAAAATAPVYALLRQPDGHLLVAGAFEQLAGQPGRALARLLPSGAIDPSFALSPALRPAAPGDDSALNLLALQPDGKVLAAGEMRFVGSSRSVNFARFSPTGAIDGSFRQYITTAATEPPLALLVQPDGKVLVGTSNYGLPGPVPPGQLRPTVGLVRLLPDGSPDPAFVLRPVSPRISPTATDALARYPDGRLLATFTSLDTLNFTISTRLERLQPNGTPDPTFGSPVVYAGLLTLQPNGRVLLTGTLPTPPPFALSLLRLLPTGLPDPSLAPTDLPRNQINTLTIQPDGAFIVAGGFALAGTVTRHCLARYLDPNVLTVTAPHQGPTFAAYPVPAHQQLHLALDAAARPQQVQLRDALGRPVLTQAVAAAALTLDVAALPAGVYLLRVQYAGGETSTRRITKE